jgi:hypothetical protein
MVGRSVGRSFTGKSHERHAASSVSSPGPAFPDPSTLVGHPQNSLTFWSVGRSVGWSIGWSVSHGEVTRTSCCLFSFVTRDAVPDPSTPCGPPPKRAYMLVGQSVTGKSHKCHAASSVSSPGPALPDPSTSCGPPLKNGLKFWSVGRSVSHGEVTRTSRCLFSFVTQAHPSRPFTPCGPPLKNGLKFWLVGWLVGWSVTGKSQEHHTASSILSPGPILPDPSMPCGPLPKRP